VKGSEISFVHKATLIPVTFMDGAIGLRVWSRA
jgi:hypothetical protein